MQANYYGYWSDSFGSKPAVSGYASGSGLPQEADATMLTAFFCSRPEAHSSAAPIRRHSITSSARARTVGGIVTPSAGSSERVGRRVDRGDAVCELVAQKILEVSERETSDAIAISRLAMKELGVPEAEPFVQTRHSKGD
jgi:hypothetical protein